MFGCCMSFTADAVLRGSYAEFGITDVAALSFATHGSEAFAETPIESPDCRRLSFARGC